MEDQKLKQLIADSIEEIEAEERANMAITQAEQIELDRLMAEVTAQTLSQVRDLPTALLPYCIVAKGPNGWDRTDSIETLKKGWLPDHFTIDAPGLVRISFRTCKLNGAHVITEISFIGLCGTTKDWTYAIAQAARLYQENEDRSKADQQMGQLLYSISARTPTTGERLESLIREIAQESRDEE